MQAAKILPPSQPDRVRMELPNRALSSAGIPGRGNMVPPITAPVPAPAASQ
jgi:hypothetical protein